MTTADIALIVSAASLGIAGLSLSWNIINATRVDRARLRAELHFNVSLAGGGQSIPVVQVSVMNIGKRPVQLTSLFLGFGRPYRWWVRVLPKRIRNQVFKVGLLVPGNNPYLSAIATELPTKLDVGDSAAVYYEPKNVNDAAAKSGHRYAFASAGGTTASAKSRRVRIPSAD